MKSAASMNDNNAEATEDMSYLLLPLLLYKHCNENSREAAEHTKRRFHRAQPATEGSSAGGAGNSTAAFLLLSLSSSGDSM